MKKLIILLLCFLTLSIAKAQPVAGGMYINELDIQYIELVGFNKFNTFNRTGSEARVWIDFGQGLDLRKESEFLNSENKADPVPFRSMVEALNYLYKYGWELVSNEPSYSTSQYATYVLRRRTPAVK